jgi:hypothetical protein
LSGCGQTTSSGIDLATTPVHLPPSDSLVDEPAARPIPREGEDLGILAARFKDYGDSNARRLIDSRARVDRVIHHYAGADRPSE